MLKPRIAVLVSGGGTNLQALIDKGVKVLVCGTCLNYYGLAERLKIGTVSNMYDILGAMQRADKVITL